MSAAAEVRESPENLRPLNPAASVGARAAFRADCERYFRMAGAQSRRARARVVLGTEGIWALACFRFGQYLRREASPRVRAGLRFPYALVHRALQMAVGIHLFPEADIGPGLYIGHYGGVWISPAARLGSNCNVSHHVTIGSAGRGRTAPRIGDNVWIGPGATVSGPVKVGKNAVVGANSLVATDVPEGALVLGIPARVVSYTGSGVLVDRRNA